MARAFSKELRERIVSAYLRGVGTIEELAIIFEVSPRSVTRYLALNRTTGDLTPKKHTGRPPILDNKNLPIIKSIILSNSDGTLQDYCDEFKEHTDIKLTIVSMHNACKKLNIRRKKRVIMRKKESA
jgi:transposase